MTLRALDNSDKQKIPISNQTSIIGVQLCAQESVGATTFQATAKIGANGKLSDMMYRG